MSLHDSPPATQNGADWDADTGHEFDKPSEPENAPPAEVSTEAHEAAAAIESLRARFGRWPRMDEVALHLRIGPKEAESRLKELSAARRYAMRREQGMRLWMPYAEATAEKRGLMKLTNEDAPKGERTAIAEVSWERKQLAFGERLKLLRTEAGLGQRELAKISGVHESTIRNYEQALNDAKLSVIYKLAGGLGVPIHDLIP